MKPGLGSFAIAGLLSGVLCWWLLYLFPMSIFLEGWMGLVYPGFVITAILLVLGKVIGLPLSGHGLMGGIMLLATTIMAQMFILTILPLQEILLENPTYVWLIDIYLQLFAHDTHLLEMGLLLLWLPSPIEAALQAAVIAFGVTFIWKLPIHYSRIVKRAVVYGILFTLLGTFIINYFLNHFVYPYLYMGETPPSTMVVSLLEEMMLISFPLFWHVLLLVIIYKAIGLKLTTTAKTDESQDHMRPSVISDRYDMTDMFSHAVAHSPISTTEIISILKTRYRATRNILWILSLTCIFIIGGTTYYYKTATTDAFDTMFNSHQTLLQQYAPEHPLYTLWPKLQACGNNRQSMKSLLWSFDVAPEIMACELKILNQLKQEREHWLTLLERATTDQLFYIRTNLLLQRNSPSHPSYALFSAVRECGTHDKLTNLTKSKNRGEPLSEDQQYFLDCLNEKKSRIQKSIDGYTKTILNTSDSILEQQAIYMTFMPDSDYDYFSPPRKAAKDIWAYWSSYRVQNNIYSGYPPTGSFQESLNRSWKFGKVIQPIEAPNERSIYFHNGKRQLLTPIVINGETQAIILSELQVEELDDYASYLWQSYRNITLPTILILALIFFWYEHRTLKRIPKDMEPSQWIAGIWRPSLLTLYLIDGFRYHHLFNFVFFMLFSILLLFLPAHELWHEELTWGMWLIHISAVMLLPIIFGLPSIPKVITDYRLFAKGVTVPCKKVDEKMESMTTGYMRHGYIHTNTEHHDRHIYEAHYKGELYQFSAPTGDSGDKDTIALINPDHTKHGLLLNAFYEDYI